MRETNAGSRSKESKTGLSKSAPLCLGALVTPSPDPSLSPRYCLPAPPKAPVKPSQKVRGP
eukprot:9304837-Pyramimonas_sp.AAC.1